MNIFKFIKDIFDPVSKVVDDLHTSKEEKMLIEAKIFEMQAKMTHKMMDYETKLLESKAKIVNSEANGQSWIQRNWRPITALTFLLLIVLDSLGILPYRLASESWELLKICLGGYIASRGIEKSLPSITSAIEAIKKKD